MRMRSPQHGLTLIELVMSIAIVGVAAVGVFALFTQLGRHTADPLVQAQATAIAQGYLEEILLLPFQDPDGGGVCPAPEASRTLYDNVCDYNGLNQTAQNADGSQVIAGYTVQVAVASSASFGGLPAADVLFVDVLVTHSSNLEVRLGGYRTNY